ncbi:hypothetical protein QN366_08790 [Pseudomonas sp. CCC3.2]|uniref:hypothetical protein n=1 Tax=unclassified Pseudomonas TaxID=196821 RepID=UPI002AB45404|nr:MULTISPECIES: hypothetical protein [unclassified Pseudomonas]MDY7558975.1 hypothetical protein [Pseudomonas sp. AB6]MEB0180163.1 hypothetical protein [Pseudomonas sp. CCC3.2]MEB0209043.1 hypothetical protein [Pseudomonas sp. AB6]
MTTDYSRPERAPFPRDLAAMIARKADALARRFEDQAIKAMVRDAQRALDRGESQANIVRELALK